MNYLIRTALRTQVPRYAFVQKLGEKEKGDEKAFFNKQDQAKVKKLAKKLGDSDKKYQDNPDKEELQTILSRYKVTYTEALVEELLKWKKD
ncbi:hypothetical protein pb186bvf_014529 [Paramecium bursaria]